MDVLQTITTLLRRYNYPNLDRLRKELSIAENRIKEELKEATYELEKEIQHVKKYLDDKSKIIPPPVIPVRYLVVTQGNTKIITILGNFKMSFNLKDTEQVVLTATVVDAEGKPASLVAIGQWTSSDTNVATITASADGKTATVVPVTTGLATVTFSVDGITATFDIDVVGGVAASATITAAAPTATPAPAPAPAAEPTPAPAA